tara:strand:- start:99 stop:305 length:207 start_codon:yes stop_codon:yes gene_type:complete
VILLTCRPLKGKDSTRECLFALQYLPLSFAQVAELVDALASGASDRKVMEVRVFSWAPLLFLLPKNGE